MSAFPKGAERKTMREVVNHSITDHMAVDPVSVMVSKDMPAMEEFNCIETVPERFTLCSS
jgi:hypothetical protein